MTTTLSYNPRNRIARATMDYILSLGVFTLQEKPQLVRKRKQRSLADDFRGAMKEMQAAEKGKIQLRTLDELLHEL